MKKITNVLINVITIITLLIGIVSAIYLALPPDFQETIPLNIREIILVLIANGGLGGFLAVIKVFRNNDKLEINKQQSDVLQLFNQLSAEIVKLRKENEIKDNDILAKLNRDIELKEAELKIKKSNPMLKEEHKELLDKIGV